jgi:hypothetical protein
MIDDADLPDDYKPIPGTLTRVKKINNTPFLIVFYVELFMLILMIPLVCIVGI